MIEDPTPSQLFSQMYFVEQFVESVVSYTSKYNTSRSILYAPDTIIGKPGNYPNYGDYSDTYMLVRVYAILEISFLNGVHFLEEILR